MAAAAATWLASGFSCGGQKHDLSKLHFFISCLHVSLCKEIPNTIPFFAALDRIGEPLPHLYSPVRRAVQSIILFPEVYAPAPGGRLDRGLGGAARTGGWLRVSGHFTTLSASSGPRGSPQAGPSLCTCSNGPAASRSNNRAGPCGHASLYQPLQYALTKNFSTVIPHSQTAVFKGGGQLK